MVGNALTYDRELLRTALDDLRELRAGPGFEPTPDIDMVWVLSAPGTYYEASNDGTYSGKSFDRLNIDAGIDVVRGITAARLDKPVAAVTRDDIADRGPVLFYNGEDKDTQKVNYLQNEDLARAVQDPEFPLPASNVIIDRIDTIGTPAQMVGFGEYARKVVADGGIMPAKIAVVSLFGHTARVGRYLQMHIENGNYPEGIEFISAPVHEGDDAIGAVTREVKKVLQYQPLGHMARTSAFAKRS